MSPAANAAGVCRECKACRGSPCLLKRVLLKFKGDKGLPLRVPGACVSEQHTVDTYLLNNYFVHQALNNVLLCFLL